MDLDQAITKWAFEVSEDLSQHLEIHNSKKRKLNLSLAYMSDYNEAFHHQPGPVNPYYVSGHNIEGYPQYLTPYLIELIQEYEQSEKSCPPIPIHRRLSYKEFLVVQRYWIEKNNQPPGRMGEWIQSPFA